MHFLAKWLWQNNSFAFDWRFEKVDMGKIFLGDEDITDMPINKRRVNTVFQNYALFPHLNVFDNVAYSHIKGVAKRYYRRKSY